MDSYKIKFSTIEIDIKVQTVTDSLSSKTDCVYVFYYMYIETVKVRGFYVITKLNFFILLYNVYQDVYEAAGDLLYWSGVYLNLFTDTKHLILDCDTANSYTAVQLKVDQLQFEHHLNSM